MSDADDVNHQAGIDDLVEDPVLADVYPVHGVLTGQSDTTRGPRLVGQQSYRGSNPLLFGARQPGDRLDRPGGDLDGVAPHASPSGELPGGSPCTGPPPGPLTAALARTPLPYIHG